MCRFEWIPLELTLNNLDSNDLSDVLLQSKLPIDNYVDDPDDGDENKAEQKNEVLTLEGVELKVLSDYMPSTQPIIESKPFNVCNNWCLDTIKIAVYTTKLLLCCPCTLKIAMKELTKLHRCLWCRAPNFNEDTTCCRCFCWQLKCGPKEIHNDLYALIGIFFLSLAPFVSLICWLLSVRNDIDDCITATEVFLPLITLTLFGKSLLYSSLTDDILEHVIHVEHKPLDKRLDGQLAVEFRDCEFLTLDKTKKCIPDLLDAHLSQEMPTCCSCDEEDEETVDRFVAGVFAILYASIHLIERSINHQYDECHAYCIYVVVVAFIVNWSLIFHLCDKVGIQFLNEIKIYKRRMLNLCNVLLIRQDTKCTIALHTDRNWSKWFNLWCLTQNICFESFQKYESTLLACCFALFASGIVIGYSLIFQIRDYNQIISDELFVSLSFLWIMFLMFIMNIMYHAYSFSSIQDKQISALRAQQTLIYHIISELSQDHVLYLGQMADSIDSIIGQISSRSLAPSILGIHIDKVFVLLIISNIVSFIPALLRLV